LQKRGAVAQTEGSSDQVACEAGDSIKPGAQAPGKEGFKVC